MGMIMKWNSAKDVFAVDEIIDQMILDWVSRLIRVGKTDVRSAWPPAADMYETPDAIIIHSELAAIDKNSLEIFLQDGYLVVRGNRPLPLPMQTAKIHRIERLYGYFERVFWIPEPVDGQQVAASYEQGMLHIRLVKVNPSDVTTVKVPIT